MPPRQRWAINLSKKEPSMQVRGGLIGRELVESRRGPHQHVLLSAEWHVLRPCPECQVLPALWKGVEVQVLARGKLRGIFSRGECARYWQAMRRHASRFPVHISLELQWHLIPGRCEIPSLTSTAKCVQNLYL